MAISPVPMTKRDKRDAAVAELLSSEASYVSDMKVMEILSIGVLIAVAQTVEACRRNTPAHAIPLLTVVLL